MYAKVPLYFWAPPYSPGPPYGRIKKLPVRISVGTAIQYRLFFNFSSIFKGKKQQFDAIYLLRVHALFRDPLFDQIYNKETDQNAFFEFISKFHQILNFFIAKLLSKLKIYTNSKKKFKFGKKQQLKKANFFLKNRII